jgi:hypothetical protein
LWENTTKKMYTHSYNVALGKSNNERYTCYFLTEFRYFERVIAHIVQYLIGSFSKNRSLSAEAVKLLGRAVPNKV